MGSQVLVHIHAAMENSDYNDLGVHTGSVKDNMTTLNEFFVPCLNVFRITAHFRLARQQLKGIIQLLKVFITLALAPFFRGKAANIKKVFPGSGCE